jgi:hypothetical protein
MTASMQHLPWELVGQIGANLLPKWRCRLYLCCKLWHSECYLAERDLFRWHKSIHDTLCDILEINYDVIEVSKYTVISKRDQWGYYVFCRWKVDGIEDEDDDLLFSYTEIVTSDLVYEWFCMDVSSEEEYDICTNEDDYNIIMALYNRYALKRDNIQMYNLYNCIDYIHEYLSDSDLCKLLIACGKNIYRDIREDPDREGSLLNRIAWIRSCTYKLGLIPTHLSDID